MTLSDVTSLDVETSLDAEMRDNRKTCLVTCQSWHGHMRVMTWSHSLWLESWNGLESHTWHGGVWHASVWSVSPMCHVTATSDWRMSDTSMSRVYRLCVTSLLRHASGAPLDWGVGWLHLKPSCFQAHMLRLKITHSNGTSAHPDKIDKSGALKCVSTLSNEPPRHSQESYVHSARQTLCLPGGTHACWVTLAPAKWAGTMVGIDDRKPKVDARRWAAYGRYRR